MILNVILLLILIPLLLGLFLGLLTGLELVVLDEFTHHIPKDKAVLYRFWKKLFRKIYKD